LYKKVPRKANNLHFFIDALHKTHIFEQRERGKLPSRSLGIEGLSSYPHPLGTRRIAVVFSVFALK